MSKANIPQGIALWNTSQYTTHPSKHGASEIHIWIRCVCEQLKPMKLYVCMYANKTMFERISYLFHTLAFTHTQLYPVFGQQMETETNHQTTALVW